MITVRDELRNMLIKLGFNNDEANDIAKETY
jgi:Fe2+ transport system protein FeoA